MSGSGAVAAAVALPLRPFIERAPARPKPVPKPARDRRPSKAAKPRTGLGRRLGAFVVSLPDHSLLDRVVRGRVWIPLLGVLLAGIVLAQVEILKLGASMGRSLEQTTTLTTQNEQLRYNVASLSDDQRIERLATSMGMVLPPPGAVGYIAANSGSDLTGALGNIHSPDPAGFMALVPTNGALVTGPGTSMLPTTNGVLAQAGTPGSATPTSTPSPTATVPSASSSTGSSATGSSATGSSATGSSATGSSATGSSATSGAAASTTVAPTDATSTQLPATQQQTPTDAQTSTTASEAPTTTSQPTATSQGTTTDTQSASQAPATGAAPVQAPTQQSSGG